MNYRVFVVVKPRVALSDLHHDDRVMFCNPMMVADRLQSSTSYDANGFDDSTAAIEWALDKFHAEFPLSIPEHFDIECGAAELDDFEAEVINQEPNFEGALSLENAQAWQATSEKFTFCIDELEISAHHPSAEKWVKTLEGGFFHILELFRRSDREIAELENEISVAAEQLEGAKAHRQQLLKTYSRGE